MVSLIPSGGGGGRLRYKSDGSACCTFLGVKICRPVLLNPLIPKSAKHQNSKKSQISFCKILKNKWYRAKVLLKRFHLNGHTIGFRQQTQKLEHYVFP